MRVSLSKKGLLSLIWGFLSSICLLSVGTAYWFQHPKNNKDTIVFIEKGSSLSQITTLLKQQGVLDFPILFKALLYGTQGWHQLKAGEYLIPSAVSPSQLIHILKKGEVILHPVTLIEGETSHGFTQKLLSDNRFQGTCEAPAEGSIFPETYHFPRGMDRQKIVKRMQNMMTEKLAEIWEARPSGHPVSSLKELVVLASIVEKETALNSEKPIVAAVFLNRLKQGMPLQADPTIIYFLTSGKGNLNRDLTRKDLQVESVYNTYLNCGLPPTPIANPSLLSLNAVLHPAEVPYLYFVADGKRGHVFSTTLEGHQKNHAIWRKVRKNTLNEAP